MERQVDVNNEQELKAAAYDVIRFIEKNQRLLATIEQALAKLQEKQKENEQSNN